MAEKCDVRLINSKGFRALSVLCFFLYSDGFEAISNDIFKNMDCDYTPFFNYSGFRYSL